MDQEINSNDELLYAKHYSSFSFFKGTRFVFIRDVPNLINKYVKGSVALDYGCGTGESSLFLKQFGFIVDGVDINKHMIQQAKNKDGTGIYNIIRSGEIPVQDEQYDLVFSSFVLVHVSSKKELLKITQEITRVLKPGGTFIAIVNNKDAYNNDWYSIDSRFQLNKNLTSGSAAKVLLKESNLVINHYYWSEEDYLKVIIKAGLTVVHIHKPLGTAADGYAWISEYTKAYSIIFVAQKTINGNFRRE